MFWIGLWSQTGDKKTYLLSESLDIWLTTRRADILSIDTRAWAGLDGVRCWEITINHTFREQCTLFDKCYMIRDRNMRLSWCELIICPNCPLPSLSADTRHGTFANQRPVSRSRDQYWPIRGRWLIFLITIITVTTLKVLVSCNHQTRWILSIPRHQLTSS